MSVSRTWLLMLLVCVGLVAASCGSGRDTGSTAAPSASFRLSLRLDEASALRRAIERKQTELCHALFAAGVTIDAAVVEEDATVLLRGLRGSSLETAQALTRKAAGSWPVEAVAGGALRIRLPDDRAALLAAVRAETLQILETRLMGLGLADARVEQEANAPEIYRVEVEGSQQPADVVARVLSAWTTLRWHELEWPSGVEDPATWLPPGSKEESVALFGGELPPNVLLIPQILGAGEGGESARVFWPVREIPALTAADIVRAEALEREDGVPTVELELDERAAKRFERVTGDNVGRRMAIVLRDEQGDLVRSTPVIRGPIANGAVIAGGLTMAEARGLAIVLTSGALPGRLELLESERL